MSHSTPGPGPQGVTVLRLSCTRSPLPALARHTGLAQPQPLGNILAPCPANRRGCFSQDAGPRGPPPPSSQGREQILFRTVPWQATAPLASPLEPWTNDTLLDIKPARVGDSLPRAGGWGWWQLEKEDAWEGLCSFHLVPSGPAEETRPPQDSPARATSDVVPGHGSKQARPPASWAHVKAARAASGRVKATSLRRPSRGCLSPRVLSSDTC